MQRIHNNKGSDWNGEGRHEWPGELRKGLRGMDVQERGVGDFARGLGIWNFELKYRVPLEIKMKEFFFNLSWHAKLDIFKIKNKLLAMSAFSIQYLMAMIILIQR